MAEQLTRLRLENELGRVDLRQDWSSAQSLFDGYIQAILPMLDSARSPGGEETKRFFAFLLTTAKNPQPYFLKGKVWNEDLLKQMAQMRPYEVEQALLLAKQRSWREAQFYEESLGEEWVLFDTPKWISKFLKEIRAKRDFPKQPL